MLSHRRVGRQAGGALAGRRRYWLVLWLCVLCLLVACARDPTAQPPESDEPAETVNPSAPVTPTPSLPPTLVPSPSPAYTGIYTGTPTPNPTPVGYESGEAVESYVVQPGETLSLIASVLGSTVEEIVAANNLVSADSIRAGQTLHIPARAAETGPAHKLVPDSELVYGPAYVYFDLKGFVDDQDGYLAGYAEEVEGRRLTGVEIVRLVSQRFSVGPRVLLALLELQSGWVTEAQPAEGVLAYPLGYAQEYHKGLFAQLSWAAVRLNQGYYGWKRGDREMVRLANGVRVAVAPELNPGTAGVQNCLAGVSDSWDEWLALVGPDGFLATYERLFGNPFAYAIEPLLPPDLKQPELRLPWEAGDTWYFTGGPHGGWGDGSGRAALDFVPSEEMLGCAPSAEWATAAAPGLVLYSDNGVVLVDLDGDGFVQSGWVLLYLHIYAEGRVEEGRYLEQGQRIGHPSCEGGAADATHLHFARRYNGQWIPAGSGALPMVLSGWTAHEDVMPYDGTLTRDGEERTALECWDDERNGLTSDNVPADS